MLMMGNWKMHKKASELESFFSRFSELTKDQTAEIDAAIDCMFAVPSPLLASAVAATNSLFAEIAAQDVHHKLEGAYTGDVSLPMITDLGIKASIIGHSERRAYHGETSELVAEKVAQCLNQGVKPVLCVGEQLDEREKGLTEQVVTNQLIPVFKLVENWDNVVVAYEPVWAIGTGLTATSAQAQAVHHYIRGLIANKYGKSVAEKATILYGGSAKPGNIAELVSQPDIDGGLVGGASLSPEDFAAMLINALATI
jgi:triosephosphate isomerase